MGCRVCCICSTEGAVTLGDAVVCLRVRIFDAAFIHIVHPICQPFLFLFAFSHTRSPLHTHSASLLPSPLHYSSPPPHSSAPSLQDPMDHVTRMVSANQKIYDAFNPTSKRYLIWQVKPALQ